MDQFLSLGKLCCQVKRPIWKAKRYQLHEVVQAAFEISEELKYFWIRQKYTDYSRITAFIRTLLIDFMSRIQIKIQVSSTHSKILDQDHLRVTYNDAPMKYDFKWKLHELISKQFCGLNTHFSSKWFARNETVKTFKQSAFLKLHPFPWNIR